VAECEETGVAFLELPLALDALAVIVNPENDWAECLSVEELHTAWAPQSEGVVQSWAGLRAQFPDRPLNLYGPGVDSGTFDYFTGVVNGKEGASRTDFTATEDDNIIVQGISGDKGGLGYLGLAYAAQAGDLIKPVTIRRPDTGDCVPASVENARAGTYQPLTRPLFFYVSARAADTKPHVRQFLDFVLSPTHASLVAEVGYVSMPEASYARVRDRFERRVTGHAGGDLAALMRGEPLETATP